MEGTNGELTQIKTHPYDRELARIKNFLKGSAKGIYRYGDFPRH